MLIVRIKEVIKQAAQGMSRPYICRGIDNKLYYVKGRNTDTDSMYKEWVCARLAQEFDLPIPPFKLVEIPENLVRALPSNLADIGAGLAFGSQGVEKVAWLEPANVKSIPIALQHKIIAFDWWIKNKDRSQFNSNLLLSGKHLFVIDHNNAFDENISLEAFLSQHIFTEEAQKLFSDFIYRQQLQSAFQALLPIFDRAVSETPDSWQWYDAEETVHSNFDERLCQTILERCHDDDFWIRS